MCATNSNNPPDGQCPARLQHAGVAAEVLRGFRGSWLPGVSLCLLGILHSLCPSAKDVMLGCSERWMLRNEGGVMEWNAQWLGKAHQASLLGCWSCCSGLPGLPFPGQELAKSVSCASAALHNKCSLWHPSCLLSLQWDSGHCHCLVALSTNFCTSALPWAVGFLQQKLGAVALLFCLGGLSRRVRLAEGARWGKERTGAAVVVDIRARDAKGSFLTSLLVSADADRKSEISWRYKLKTEELNNHNWFN